MEVHGVGGRKGWVRGFWKTGTEELRVPWESGGEESEEQIIKMYCYMSEKKK